MEHVRVVTVHYWHRRLLHAVGEGSDLVAKDVVLGADHEGRRQARQIASQEGRRIPIGAVGFVGQILVPIPGHTGAAEYSYCEFVGVVFGLAPTNNRRVHQQLKTH
jgi:hypothetical protein